MHSIITDQQAAPSVAMVRREQPLDVDYATLARKYTQMGDVRIENVRFELIPEVRGDEIVDEVYVYWSPAGTTEYNTCADRLRNIVSINERLDPEYSEPKRHLAAALLRAYMDWQGDNAPAPDGQVSLESWGALQPSYIAGLRKAKIHSVNQLAALDGDYALKATVALPHKDKLIAQAQEFLANRDRSGLIAARVAESEKTATYERQLNKMAEMMAAQEERMAELQKRLDDATKKPTAEAPRKAAA